MTGLFLVFKCLFNCNLLFGTLNGAPGTNAMSKNLPLRFSGRAVTSSLLRIMQPLLLPSLVSQVTHAAASYQLCVCIFANVSYFTNKVVNDENCIVIAP